ncbi:PEP-CTERM sorting domain-containing protein [Ferrovum myxofaciens]|uniref:PEP-CTERM sorting domain-containing protein n=1 Tax=Ferrovum myxofaciens TaxID=416213 RepID=UPI002356CC13|nr:PEP-CTERM sorting domain-containing protein [Ferrovum myxofaciens]MBU6995382.1 PEP-CTERM sorting domain-containing protein [Ferrovum myxofaciens]
MKNNKKYSKTMIAKAVAACLIGAVFTAPTAWAGFQTIDLSGIVNAPFSDAINGSTFPTGNQTYNGVPFNIANVAISGGGTNNFWTGGGSSNAPSGTYSTTLTFGNILDVTNVYTMINTLWGTTNTNPTPLNIAFNAGNGVASYTKSLVGNVDVRDYNNGFYTTTINGTTTTNAFTNGQGQRLDMQNYALPSYFLTDGLASITLTEIGAPGYEKAMFNALTLQTSAGVPAAVPEPASVALLGIGLLGLMAGLRRYRRFG